MEQVGLISRSVVSLSIHPWEPFQDIGTDLGIDVEAILICSRSGS
jgi:hypothetical protein